MTNFILNILSLEDTSANWKWIFLFISPFAFYLLNFLLYITIKFVRKKTYSQFSKNVHNTFAKYFTAMQFEQSLSWIITCLPLSIFIENYEFNPRLEKYLFISLKIIFAINLVKLLLLISDSLCFLLTDLTQKTNHPLDKKITPLISKTLRIFIVLMGALIFLQNLGVNVTAIIAGLGVGGVAIAFAAQNTVSNVFGTITILLDVPFKIGDRIRVNNTEGKVEDIGFRSTRIRTASNTLVSLPNALVASLQIDNLTEINSIYRFKAILAFEQKSSNDILSKFTNELIKYFQKDSKIIYHSISVTFSEITEYSKNITVTFQYTLKDTLMTESQNQEIYLYQIDKIKTDLNLSFFKQI